MRTKQFEEFLDSIEYDEIVELRTKPDMNLMRAFRCDPVDWKEFIDAFLAENYPDDDSETDEEDSDEEDSDSDSGEEMTEEEQGLYDKLSEMEYLDILDWKTNYSEEEIQEFGMTSDEFEQFLDDYILEEHSDESSEEED